MNLVFFVVETEGIHDQVDTESKCDFTCSIAPCLHIELPGAKLIPSHRTGHIVGYLDDRKPLLQCDTFKMGAGWDSPAMSVEQVKAFVKHVVRLDSFELLSREDTPELPPHAPVERSVRLTVGEVHDQSTASFEELSEVMDSQLSELGEASVSLPENHGVIE